MKRVFFFSGSILLLALLPLLAVFAVQSMDDVDHDQAGSVNPAGQIDRGAYLARVGDCMACHSARGAAPYAGGRVIATEFGNFVSPNITPDMATGLGNWTADDFWRALHHGKGRDGSFLYPVFPFPSYTKVTRADSDALFAYLKTLTPVHQPVRQHALRFPFNQRWLLAFWRALYFRSGVYQPDQQQSAQWNRGAYLVEGLGHCNACHTSRTVLGASQSGAELAGGLIPMLNWYAPSLTSDAEAGLGNWEERHIVDLLKTGVSAKGAVFGPMAEVVSRSLQHLSDEDVRAMAVYLKSLPKTGDAVPDALSARSVDFDNTMKLGAKVYEKHCADCHQKNGQGDAPAYPPLAGNQALLMQSAVNPIRLVLNGGYAPSTAGNPRPFGMPPFANVLNDAEVLAVVTYMRNSWGNHAAPVEPGEVNRDRGVPAD